MSVPYIFMCIDTECLFTLYLYSHTKSHMTSGNKKPSSRQGKPTVPPASKAQHPTFNHEEKAISQRWHSSMHAMLTKRCSWKLQLTPV